MTQVRRYGAARVLRSDKEVRALLRGSLVHALTETHTSQNEAAKWLKTNVSTLRRWLSESETAPPVDVARVMRSRLLSKHFIRCLALMERKTRGERP